MTTVREICEDALIEIGAKSVSDSMPAEDAAYALRTLNRMLGKWNTEELMVYTVNRDAYSLVSGQQSYTIGTGGDFSTPRPVRIQAASVLLSSGAEIPIDIINDQEWQATVMKSTASTFPTKIWITGNVPLNTIWCWPVPSDSTVDLVLYTWGKTEAFTSINDTVVFPNGYEEALVTNLAVALSNSYGTQPSPSLSLRAADAKSKIESLNVDPMYMSTEWGGSSIAIQSFGTVVDR